MSQNEEKVLHNFNALIGVHADGATNNELSEGLRDLIATMSNNVMERGGKQKGKITLTCDFTLDQGTIDVLMEVKIVKPKAAAAKSVYWATEGNKLTQSNPKQTEMFNARSAHLQAGESRTA